MAVLLQLREIRIASLREIHFHAIDDFLQLFLWQFERLDDRYECLGHRVLRRVYSYTYVINPCDLPTPPRELCARNIDIAAFVYDIIDFTTESVERGDCAAPRRRQEQEAVVKTRAALRRFFLAIFVGSHSNVLCSSVRDRGRAITAWAVINNQSCGRSTGRESKTSYRAFAILVRMRSPPAIIMRISSPTRPFSTRPNIAPSNSMRRARCTWKSMNLRHASLVS